MTCKCLPVACKAHIHKCQLGVEGLKGGKLMLKHMTDGWRGLTMVDEEVSVSISWV